MPGFLQKLKGDGVPLLPQPTGKSVALLGDLPMIACADILNATAISAVPRKIGR